METLTRDEVTRLIDTAYADALEAAYVLAVTLGMRQGELRRLRPSPSTERRRFMFGAATRGEEETTFGDRPAAVPPPSPLEERIRDHIGSGEQVGYYEEPLPHRGLLGDPLTFPTR